MVMFIFKLLLGLLCIAVLATAVALGITILWDLQLPEPLTFPLIYKGIITYTIGFFTLILLVLAFRLFFKNQSKKFDKSKGNNAHPLK